MEKKEHPINTFIKKALKGKGLTQSNLAKALGKEQGTISNRLNSSKTFSFGELSIIARLIGVDIEELNNIQESNIVNEAREGYQLPSRESVIIKNMRSEIDELNEIIINLKAENRVLKDLMANKFTLREKQRA